jgi:hypothetical protein
MQTWDFEITKSDVVFIRQSGYYAIMTSPRISVWWSDANNFYKIYSSRLKHFSRHAYIFSRMVGQPFAMLGRRLTGPSTVDAAMMQHLWITQIRRHFDYKKMIYVGMTKKEKGMKRTTAQKESYSVSDDKHRCIPSVNRSAINTLS